MTKTIEISYETWEKIKDQIGEDVIELDSVEDMVGKKWLIRTVTYHMVGELEKTVGKLWKLKNASWVADTGRFMNALKSGFDGSAEIEPVGDMLVNSESIVDIFPWKHALPNKQQ